MKKDALDENIAAYEARLKELEKHHMGKWVVFRDCVLVDAFDTFHNAADHAARRFGRGPYLIRQVGEPPVCFLPRPVPRESADDIQIIIKQIFQSCQKLTQLTGRPFSPDGHLVGSFGEVIARDKLNLTPKSPSNDGLLCPLPAQNPGALSWSKSAAAVMLRLSTTAPPRPRGKRLEKRRKMASVLSGSRH